MVSEVTVCDDQMACVPYENENPCALPFLYLARVVSPDLVFPAFGFVHHLSAGAGCKPQFSPEDAG
jgi:hypothetical protein